MRRFFVLSILLLLFVSVSSLNAADELPPAQTVADWDKLKEAGKLPTGEVIATGEGKPAWLKIVVDKPGMHTLPLIELKSPPITTPSYAIRGRIRYENVVGTGFLEMWSHFAGDQQYFSRTLDTSGPMGMITGTSTERSFELPFHTFGKAPAPEKLTINLVLNGPGTVEIGPLEITAIPAMSGGEGSEAWWSGPMAGLIGGVGGSFLGLLGGIIGTLVGVGKGQRIVQVLAAILAACGIVAVVAGIVAMSTGQPFTVYYVLLLLGAMMTFFGILILGVAPARYRAHEMRRMQALDAT